MQRLTTGAWLLPITATSICVIMLKREDAFGLAYSLFREPNVAHFKMRYSTYMTLRLTVDYQFTNIQ